MVGSRKFNNRMRTFIISMVLVCFGLTSCEKDKHEYPQTIETEVWEAVSTGSYDGEW